MKIEIKFDGLNYVIEGAKDLYNETTAAEPSGRLLEGYYQEYIGYGDVLGIPVKAVYLLFVTYRT